MRNFTDFFSPKTQNFNDRHHRKYVRLISEKVSNRVLILVSFVWTFLGVFFSRPRGTCAPYNGTFCKGILGNSIIFLNASYGNPALEQDREVDELMEKVLSSSVRKPECEDAARKVFCHHIFPGCTEEASKARPIHLCKYVNCYATCTDCLDNWPQ